AKELGIDTSGVEVSGTVTFPDGWVRELAADLQSARGRSLILVGSRQPAAVQQVVAAINSHLGNLGTTITGIAASGIRAPGLPLADLAAKLEAKEVKTLVILGGNPAYNAPGDLKWAERQKNVENVL